MITLNLANVVLEHNERFSQAPTLLYRSTGVILECSEKGVFELHDSDHYDFTTYFNSLPIQKWRLYSIAENFSLHLEVKGATSELTFTKLNSSSKKPELIEKTTKKIPTSDDWAIIDIALPPDEAAVIGFALDTDGAVFIRNAYYYTTIEEEKIRPVNLALATTTFKKEDFILPNIQLLKDTILESNEPIAKHFTVHVVDNGRTLDKRAIETESVHIHPNPNAGGAGGFARGMIEALRQKPIGASHILLMDDDVAVLPESIMRTYSLLSLVNDTYKDAFISGAMLNFDIPEDQWEDTGYIGNDGRCWPRKPPLRMTLAQDVALNASLEIEDFKGAEGSDENYAAWWYCCIPSSVVKKSGLPLPVFVRYDDIEYSLRNKPKIITMNGIGIWHVSFHLRYNAAVERYQTTRNGLIMHAVSNVAVNSNWLEQLHNNLQIELKSFNYKNAVLLLEGLEDYMKGPEYIMTPGVAEQRFMDAGKNSEKLAPLEDLEKELGPLNVNKAMIYEDSPRSAADRVLDFVTFNGQRSFIKLKSGEEMPIIPYEGWLYMPGKIHGSHKVLAVDVYNRRGIIRTRDTAQFKKIWSRYKADVKEYRKRKVELEQAYAAKQSEMTSTVFWMKYLGLSDGMA